MKNLKRVVIEMKKLIRLKNFSSKHREIKNSFLKTVKKKREEKIRNCVSTKLKKYKHI